MLAGDTKAADRVTDLLSYNLQRVKDVRNRPYFGRIIYSTDVDGAASSIYIGDVNVNNLEEPQYFIASRNAPIARLYYRP